MLRLLYYFLFLFITCVANGFSQAEFRLGVEVKDKYTKRSLFPIVSVLEVNSESELKGKMVNDAYVVIVKPNTQYQVFVALQEYRTYKKTHTFEANTIPINGIYPFAIDLESVNPPKNAPPPSVVNEVSKATPTTGAVSAQATPKPATILKTEIRFVAIDALTGKPVSAQFKLTDDVKEVYTGNTDAQGGLFKPTVLIQKQPYSLIVTATGYRKHQSKVEIATSNTSNQIPQIIKLSKEDVLLKIRVFEDQSTKPVIASIRIIDQTNKEAVLNLKNVENGQASASLNPGRKYTVEVEAKGFMPYQQALEKSLPSLEQSNDLTIKLTKIGDTYLQLTAIDAATGQRIAANFKITASGTEQTTNLKGTTAPTPLKHVITEPDIYHIETIAPGYTPLQYDIDAEEMGIGQVFNYEAKLISTTTKPTSTAPLSRVFTFNILDAQTQKAVPDVRAKIKNHANQKPILPKINAAMVKAELQAGQNYLIEIEAKGYEPASMNIETATWAKRGEFLTNISLVPLKSTVVAKIKPVINEKIFDNIKAGQSLTIEDNVYFDQSSYILRPEAHGQLNRLAAIMIRTPLIKIEIVGHTDNMGDPRLNQTLSEQRAKVIANYLRNQGALEANISHRGQGASAPLAPNDSEENRQRNRRVQFLVK